MDRQLADASGAYEHAGPYERNESRAVSEFVALLGDNTLMRYRLDYYKHTQSHVTPVELHSPQPGQEEFRAELADNSQKAPRT